MVCGNNAVSGEDLYREIKGVGSFYQSFQGFLRKVHFALELMSRSAHDVEAHLRPLIELIENFRTWDATRPVDKVYALRPLSSDASRYLELQPDYTLPQGILAQKLVRSAFPNSVISPLSTTGNEVTFEVKGLLLGTYRSAGGANGDRSWSFSAGKSDLPNAVFNPDVLEIFRENWYIWMVGIRKLHEDGGAVVLLQGASRPTTLRYHGGRYIVDMLATPEPIKERTQFPKLRGEAWSIALKALSAISDGLMKFKLSWDPFRRPYPSEFNIYVPAPNDLRNQWDALIEWCKDEAEEISEDNHDSRLINILVARFYSQTHGLESGTNENTITIHQAAAKGRFRTVKHLLECNAPVNSRDGNTEMTPLHMAAIVGHNRVVKALLDAKAETDSLDRYNATPLWHAIYQGHSKICQILLDAGADPNFSGNELNSPIVTAVDEGYADIVSALLKAGASVECMDPVAGPTFSQLATELGDKGAINALFSSSSELKPQGGYDNDSLSHAAAKGRTEIIKLLLDAGTDVNSQNLVGMTPLDSAVYKGHHKTAEVLWQAGGQLNIIKIFKTMDEDGDLEDEKGTTAWKLIIDRYDL